jgi:hypothetical protein
MTRRLIALERFGGYLEAAARWTDEPRTAMRTVRLRGTWRPIVAASKDGCLTPPGARHPWRLCQVALV